MSDRDDELFDEAWEEAEGIVLCTPALLIEALNDLINQEDLSPEPVDVDSMLYPEFDLLCRPAEQLLAVVFGATDDKVRLSALDLLQDKVLLRMKWATRRECDKVLKRRAEDLGEHLGEMRKEARETA